MGRPQHRQGLGVGQLCAKGGQRGRVELPKGIAQPVDLALTGPDQRLVGAGEDLDRLGQLRVASDRAVMVAISADQIGQHPRIPTVGLGPGGGMPLPVAAGRQRVDPLDLVASSGQRADQQPSIGLDPNHHLPGLLSMVSDQLVQPSHALDPIRHPSGG